MSSATPDDHAARRALDVLFAATYDDLRRRASRQVRPGDARITLSATGVVNEAWFRLAQTPALGGKSRAEFLAIAANAMRQVLIEAARRRNAQKRHGRAIRVPFEDLPHDQPMAAEDLLALDHALHELARIDARQARLVEQRFFGGMTIPELAGLLGVSDTTVKRDLRAAEAWLKARLDPH